MARSLLRSFVGGTRQMLTLQLLVSVGTIGLAGYTFVVTNNALRERNRLAERVIVLEEALGQAGIAPPQENAAPAAPPEVIYPPSVDQPATPAPPVEETAPPAGATTAPPPVDVIEQPSDPQPPTQQTVPPQNTDTPPANPPATTQPPAFDPTSIIRDLLTPPPALRTLVLHVRARTDVDEAQQIARALGASGLSVSIDVLSAEDARQSGYSYYHARQNRAAADVAQRVQDAARGAQIAAWSVQLRGASLPANGEYAADRLDVVLPPIPAAPPPRDTRFNSEILRDRAITTLPATREDQTQQPVVR